MSPTYSRQHAAALAELLRLIRPSWDALATINALHDVADRPLADVARAAILTAQDHDARTPRAITFTDSDHWRSLTADARPQPVRRTEQCPRHEGGTAGRCPMCRSEQIAHTTTEETP
ncbi:hypothetical protein DT076_16695 [Desertihabitans brevis]|uniref:Uncharacterized protein n=1 Tax=Desertihabitans brevis TaxID=2268447 RepID=A0A367YQX1_9ACTN|nr:hypothetical protein [Desertihabitans brevis]RCK68285.1 hypothetical protein DT076_16695 [Desertihabitans brevis]